MVSRRPQVKALAWALLHVSVPEALNPGVPGMLVRAGMPLTGTHDRPGGGGGGGGRGGAGAQCGWYGGDWGAPVPYALSGWLGTYSIGCPPNAAVRGSGIPGMLAVCWGKSEAWRAMQRRIEMPSNRFVPGTSSQCQFHFHSQVFVGSVWPVVPPVDGSQHRTTGRARAGIKFRVRATLGVLHIDRSQGCGGSRA